MAQTFVNATTYKFEDYIKEDGTTGRRRTNQIQVNSTAQMLLFYRVIIENYTDLEVETEGFYEEYDALNESGVLFELTADFEGHPSLIPAREISELRGMIKMKQEDEIFNRTEIHKRSGRPDFCNRNTGSTGCCKPYKKHSCSCFISYRS